MLQLEFKEVKLFRGRMTILLPANFMDMPDYLAKRKYPSKYRPPVIMTSEDTLVNYLFNLMETPLPKSEIENAAKGLYDSLKRTQPMGVFDKISMIDRINGQVAWFFYHTKTLDAELFQIAYITDIHGKLMYGAFNCLLEEKNNWFENILYSIRSIHEVEDNHYENR